MTRPASHPRVISDSRPQINRFIETARALECDEDEAAFKAKLPVIARQEPKDRVKPKPKPDAET